MSLYESTIRSRDYLQFLVPLAVLVYAFLYWRRRELLSRLMNPVSHFFAQHSNRVFLLSALSYFGIALLCKFSQANSLQLSALDFWLFEDMLFWLGQGEPYITRFSAHGDGPVQHGGVHAFLTFLLLYPFVKLFGPTLVALAYNPAVVALGGYLIAKFSMRITGSGLLSFLIAAAFWMSEFTSRVVMHEMHPEAAYPALVVFALSYSLNKPRLNHVISALIFVLAWALLGGMKQDALLIGGTIWLWLTLNKKWSLDHALVSGVVLLSMFLGMTVAIGMFKNGSLGSQVVAIGSQTSIPVTIPNKGSHIIGGHQISGIEGITKFLTHVLEKHGSLLEFALGFIKYFFTSPFLYFWLVAPWLWLRRDFWILVIPIALAYYFIGSDLKTLSGYHSAPLLAGLWMSVIFAFKKTDFSEATARHQLKCAWLLVFSAVHGGASLTYYVPSEAAKLTTQEVQEVTKNLPEFGLVSSRLISGAPRDKLWMSQFPVDESDEFKELSPRVKWVLLTKENPTFEIPSEIHQRWKEESLNSGRWKLINFTFTELYLRAEDEPIRPDL